MSQPQAEDELAQPLDVAPAEAVEAPQARPGLHAVSRSGLREALELPDHLRADLILQLGHPAPSAKAQQGRGPRLRIEDITDWDAPGGAIPDE